MSDKDIPLTEAVILPPIFFVNSLAIESPRPFPGASGSGMNITTLLVTVKVLNSYE